MAEDSVIKVTLKRWKYTPPTGTDRKYFPRVELRESVLIEGERFSLEDKTSLAVDLVVNVVCNSSDPSNITNLVQYPLLISFLEVLPKDKKQKEKEDRTNIVGQASLDLLPYLQGSSPSSPSSSSSSSCTLTLHTCEAHDATPKEDRVQSSIEVEVDTSGIDSKDAKLFENSNVLSLCMRSIHCLPESWQPGSYEFTASLPLPPSAKTPTGTSPNAIVIPRGQIKPPRSQDHTSFHTHWMWPGKILAPEARKTSKIQSRPLEEEVGIRNQKSDLEFRQTCELDQASVVWNIKKRVWLFPDYVTALLTSLSSSSCWPLEVGRYTTSSSGGGKSAKTNKEVDPVLQQRAVAYLNLSPLVYPGSTKICGAFHLNNYSEAEVLKQTGHSFRSSISPSGPSPDETAAKKLSVRALTSSAKIGDTLVLPGDEGTGGEGTRGSGSDESHIYVYLEIELLKPLIMRREAIELTDRVKDYITPRPPLPLREGGAEQAIQHFQQQASSIASQLVTEFSEINMTPGKSSKGVGSFVGKEDDDTEERRLKFLYHLNSSGKYYSIKEQFKRSVVKIVREKYLNQVPRDDELKYQQFLSELYVFLVDQMHIGLRKVLSIEGSLPSVDSPLTSDLLKHFAFEAQSTGDYELTHRYHKERVSRRGYNAEVWYDYAVFCLLASLHDRCEQCLKEAIAIDTTMIPALLLYGMVCCIDDKYDQADDLFEMATTQDPTNIIAWTMRGLYYEHAGNKSYKDMCLQEAHTLHTKHQPKTFLKQCKPPPHINTASHTAIQSRGSLSSAKPLTLKGPSSNSLKQLSVSTLGKAVKEKADSVVSDDSQKETESKASTTAFPEMEAHPKGVEWEDQESRSSMKSLQNGNPKKPHEDEKPTASIFLQTACYLLDAHALKFADMALAHELTESLQQEPTPLYETTVARLHMQKREYKEAREYLERATVRDIQDSDAWALLGHAHFLMGNYAEAKDIYERTLCFVDRPAHVHLVHTRLADIFFDQQKYTEARATLLHACRESPSSLTWRGVGVACYKLGDLQQAEDALSEANILNNQDSLTWAYLTMVCIMTKRSAEAEQALKFSIKTGLNDDALILEIRKLHQIHTPDTPLVHLPPLIQTWSATHCTSPTPTTITTSTQ